MMNYRNHAFMCAHNIYSVPRKDYSTKSNPNTNSLFLYHIELLATFILSRGNLQCSTVFRSS